MPFEPVEPRRLYRRIAEQVAALIAAGELPPGSRLPAERDLAARLGVSRPSLREALIALEIEGLVEIRGGSGITVRAAPGATSPPHAADAPGIFDVLDTRLIVEPECAALAARGDDEARGAVGAAFARLAADMTAGRGAIEADEAFHLAIAAASGNGALLRIVASLWRDQAGPIAARLSDLAMTGPRLRANLAEHASIAEAIASRDAAGARRAMRRHLSAMRRVRLTTLGEKEAAPDATGRADELPREG